MSAPASVPTRVPISAPEWVSELPPPLRAMPKSSSLAISPSSVSAT